MAKDRRARHRDSGECLLDKIGQRPEEVSHRLIRFSVFSFSIQVAQLKKFAEGSGLGISLEGTVDVENGQEVRPHHYIRSILPEGPVGQNGTLRSGDELLEVISISFCGKVLFFSLDLYDLSLRFFYALIETDIVLS